MWDLGVVMLVFFASLYAIILGGAKLVFWLAENSKSRSMGQSQAGSH
ncbi:hypothetical protein [Thermus antranikianii]